MSKRINMLLSSISLFVTSLLLLFIIFGWYTSNKNVSANGIFGSTSLDEYTLDLERGIWDDSSETFSWASTKSLSIKNVAPKDKFYFRIKIDTANELKVKISFNSIESYLVEDKLIYKDSKIYLKEDDHEIELYDFDKGEKNSNN